VGGECHPPATLPGGKGPGTHCIGGWVGPRAGLDRCGKSRPHRHSRVTGPSSPQLVAIPTELSRPTIVASNNKQSHKLSSYNKSQQDAVFLNFILVKNSTCLRQIYCPSSGVLILYSQQLVFANLQILEMGKITSVNTCTL